MNSDSKFFIGVVIAAVLVLAGFVLFSGDKSAVTGDVVEVDTSLGHKLGSDNPKVTVVEFGDFQCPACQAAVTGVKEMLSDNPDDVQLVFRHFPLPIHGNADEASQAAEAASLQGKFWEMHDLLYQKQQEWQTLGAPEDTFRAYARELGLDEQKFVSDYRSNEVKQVIDKDVDAGSDYGVDRTPTFFVNGKRYTGVLTAAQWQAAINEAKQ